MVHHRWERTWQFIYLNEDVIKIWVEAEENDAAERFALLRATIDHELGYWMQTLVSTCLKLPKVPSSWKSMPKRIGAPWTGEGEAGTLCSRGVMIRIRRKVSAHLANLKSAMTHHISLLGQENVIFIIFRTCT